MAVAAEQETMQSLEHLWESFDLGMPEVLVVPEMLFDQQTRLRAARFIGGAVIRADEMAECDRTPGTTDSLYEAIHKAQTGDSLALALVESNVGTDVVERTIKTGHVMSPVELTVAANGTVSQHGQSMEAIQANSLRYASDHPVMRRRTEAEARNSFRIKELNAAGFFDDYSFVVISRAENLPEEGFFTATMSCAIQVTAKQGEGLATESAFVAGIAAPGAEQHDEATAVALGVKLGVDLAGKLPAEIIDTPILIHNSVIPNGAIDIVALWDDCAGGTFFGEEKPRQDYLEYLELCKQREEGFKPKIRKITEELIGKAAYIDSPLSATEMLHKLSENHMVEYAISDTSIDARVFGSIAAPNIELARLAAEYGDSQATSVYTQKAKDTAQTNSCPGTGKSGSDSANKDTTPNSESDQDCDFVSKKCPMCGEKNVKTKVTKTHIVGACGCRKKK